ncbi:MAG: FHA domain-containing protein [Solirubrobacterales bacterium]
MPGTFTTGEFPGAGTYFCVECGSQLSIQEDDRLPCCPRCENESFRLDSIFESMQDHSATTAEFAAPAEPGAAAWLEQHRASLAPGSRHLVCRLDDGETIDFEIEHGWTRIGRSVAADLRLDDPSVSRRHALVVSEPGEPLRVLDDRSLNGVLVNGEPIEWARLEDGDELRVGSFRLYTLEA